MHRTFGIDVLVCPQCGGRLRLIATVLMCTVASLLGAVSESGRLRQRDARVVGEQVANSLVLRTGATSAIARRGSHGKQPGTTERRRKEEDASLDLWGGGHGDPAVDNQRPSQGAGQEA